MNKLENWIFEPVRITAFVLTISAVTALVLGWLWMLLGWMRFYGLETGVVAQAIPFDVHDYHNSFLNITAIGIDWYNGFFQGNSRFGSGIGLMAGSCFSLLFLKRSSWHGKMLAACLAGAIVGGRFCLTFTSAPAPFLFCSLVAAICFLIIQCLTKGKLRALPDIDYWKARMPLSESVG